MLFPYFKGIRLDILQNTKKINQSCLPGCALTLSDTTPPLGKIQPFSKIVVTFETVLRFWYPLGFRVPYTLARKSSWDEHYFFIIKSASLMGDCVCLHEAEPLGTVRCWVDCWRSPSSYSAHFQAGAPTLPWSKCGLIHGNI